MADSVLVWLKFFFILFMTICCAFLGMLLSKFFIPKSVGLAGGAMVLGYGVLGLFFGLVLGFIFKNRMSKPLLVKTTVVLAFLGIGCLTWFYGKFRASQLESKQQVAEMQEFARTHKATAQKEPMTKKQEAPPYGYGLAKPHLEINTVLYFYSSSDSKSVVDSISFVKNSQGDIVINPMPDWLKPINLKLDYQIFNLRAFSQSRGRVQVSVNEQTGQKYWMSKVQANVQPWSSFLINVFAVEPLDWKLNPVKTSPTKSAKEVIGINPQTILRPLEIKNDWMEVLMMDENHKEKGRGWILWRTAEKLIIEYSLLS